MDVSRFLPVLICLLATGQGQEKMSTKPCTGRLINCFQSPCVAASCASYSAAECRSNYCGGCSAEFWVGDTEVTNLCNEPPPFAPARTDDCADRPIRCLMNPCDGQTCENYPDARCTPNYCTCKPTFVSGSGDVTSLCKNPPETAKAQTSTGTSTKTCASGVYVNCLTSPCKINSCGPHPEAECRDNNCDDCSAEFWIGDTEVTSSCGDTGPKISFGATRKSASGRRPSTMDRVPPPADDTDTRIPFGPLLPTTGSGIGFGPRIPSTGSGIEFGPRIPSTGSGIEFGPLIPNIPSPPKAQSPRKKCRNSCVFPPCMFRVCAAFPDAKCTNDYCGGCTARYYVNAEEVTDRCNAQIPSSTPSRRLGIFSRLRGRSNSRRQNSSPQEEKQQSRYFSPWSWLFGSYF